MSIDRELIRRGVIVPTFKTKQNNDLSYTFKGSRVIFTEAPKENSKCSVFYFRGSKRDVETVEPVQSLKPGDIVQIKENRFDYELVSLLKIIKYSKLLELNIKSIYSKENYISHFKKISDSFRIILVLFKKN